MTVEITPTVLIAVIRDIDTGIRVGSSTEIEYIEVMRWNHEREGGECDDKVTALLRALARERLGAFAVADIGAAVLAEIDS